VLAVAKGVALLFGNLNFHWGETASLVRTITKRLLAGFPAGAPPILSWF